MVNIEGTIMHELQDHSIDEEGSVHYIPGSVLFTTRTSQTPFILEVVEG